MENNLDYLLSRLARELIFILHCNFDTRKLPFYPPTFYKECLDARSWLNKQSILSFEDVANQGIWNNKHIFIKKHSVFEKHILQDFLTVAGLYFRRVNMDLSPIDRFKLMGLMDAVPVEWRKRV